MSTSKREEVSSHLRYIRQELRDLDQMLGQYGLLPELSELKEVYNSLDALHQLLSGKVKKKPKPEFDDWYDYFYLKRDLILFNFNLLIVQFSPGLVKKILSPSILKEIIELVNYKTQEFIIINVKLKILWN